MGRIGRTYPRFQPPPEQPAAPRRAARSQLVGAVVGLLAALALIGFLLTR